MSMGESTALKKVATKEFTKYDSKKKGRIDVMDFLKAVDSISKEFPTVLDVDYPAINLAFKTRAIGEGISLNEFLDAVTELVSAFGATSPKISKHKENEVIPRVKEPPAASTELIQEASLFNSRRASTDRRKLRGDGTFRSPSNAPPTTDHDRLEHDSNIRKRGTASLKLVDIKNATIRGINDIGRWFGVREDGESELIIRSNNTHPGTVQCDCGSDEDIDSKNDCNNSKASLIFDYPKALTAYCDFVAKEKKCQRDKIANMFSSSGSLGKIANLFRSGSHGSAIISGVAKDANTSSSKSELPQRISRRLADSDKPVRRNTTMIRNQLRDLELYNPWFIRIMTFVQFVVLVVMLIDSFQQESFATVTAYPITTPCTTNLGASPQCPQLFNGAVDVTAIQTEPANPWVGPDAKYLVQFGGAFPPCMRDDSVVNGYLETQRETECGGNRLDCEGGTFTAGIGMSCCANFGVFGMTTYDDCTSVTGSATNWREGPTSTGHDQCDAGDEHVVLHPCCTDNIGSCSLYTESQCAFYGGIYHNEKILCSEVACLQETCTTKLSSPEISTLPGETNVVITTNQWFRFIWPLFLHAGLIHYVLCMVVQWIIGSQIERTAGWLRVMLIYFISGVGGYIVAGIFDGTSVTVGSDPAVFGLLAVVVVELGQSWQIVPSPWIELCKLSAVIIIAFLIGTLPFLNNFAHIGGFIFGVLSALLFLPYITFGKWDVTRKKILVYLAGPTIFVLFIVCIVIFYNTGDDFCPMCYKFNCVEWTAEIHCD